MGPMRGVDGSTGEPPVGPDLCSKTPGGSQVSSDVVGGPDGDAGMSRAHGVDGVADLAASLSAAIASSDGVQGAAAEQAPSAGVESLEPVPEESALARRVHLVGAGVMGQTCVRSWLRAGGDPHLITVVVRRPEAAAQLGQELGVQAVVGTGGIGNADVVVVAVKPQDVPGVLSDISARLAPGAVVVSLAAGVTTMQMERSLPVGTPVVRVMPNTPAQVNQGMSAVSAGHACGPEHVALTESLLAPLGQVVQVPESQQDAVTAVSGSGPAYLFYVVEAMIEAGVLLGMPRAVATELVKQTVMGAATMLAETDRHPTQLREDVSSPAGTTMAALRVLDDNKVRAAFLSAMEAARDRSQQLSGEASCGQ